MASSCCNSSTSTPVPPLGILFNTISHFSNHLAYLLNALQQSRWIHQRGHSSLRSLSSTIHSGLSDPVGEVANMLDDLCMKPGNKISMYNVDFMCYISQLGWGNSVLCYYYYQGLPNQIQDPIFT